LVLSLMFFMVRPQVTWRARHLRGRVPRMLPMGTPCQSGPICHDGLCRDVALCTQTATVVFASVCENFVAL
jgi:hypothetical protein